MLLGGDAGRAHYSGQTICRDSDNLLVFVFRDFGIKPISIAGGTVKVKDELKIEFDIRANTRIASK